MANPIQRAGGETPKRSTSSATTDAQYAQIYRAQVTGVNMSDYTVDVVYESYPHSVHLDIPWMVPYIHQNQGEGMTFMPEVGCTVWVCKTSERGRDAFVLGWTPVQEKGTYRAGRELLNPGDFCMKTRDANFLYLRRGGIVQIGATPVCQRIYIPIRNIIRDIGENYQMSLPSGDLTWETMRTEQQSDGHQRCLYTLACKEYSDDPNANPIAVLKIGSHGDKDDTILSLTTRDKGNGDVKASLTISKAGTVTWTLQGDLTTTVTGNMSTTVKQAYTVSSTQDMSFTSQANLKAKAVAINLSASGSTLDLAAAAAALNGAAVNLGDALGPVVIDNGTLGAWIQAVTLLLSGPPSSVAFRGILPPLTYKSTKVKA